VDSLTRLGTVVKRALDQPPAVLAMGPLKYPDDLRRMGIQGRVVIRCIVGRDGLVEPGTIAVVSADDPGLVFAAREAVRSTRFRPGRDRGEAVRTLVYLPIDFKIRITAGRP
jgi:protein TonB